MDNQEKTQIPEEMDKREKRRRTYSMPEFLTVSPSPHIKSPDTTATVMFDVLIALTPALIWGVWSFGLRALILVLISVGASIGFEAAVQFLLKRPITVTDLSAAVTRMLLGMNLPATAPLWMPAVGAFFAIVVVKQLFGGIGQNFANPAATARIVMIVAFSGEMTKWVNPVGCCTDVDARSTATPLVAISRGGGVPS